MLASFCPPQAVRIWGEEGGELVELSKFCRLLSAFVPTNYDNECSCRDSDQLLQRVQAFRKGE